MLQYANTYCNVCERKLPAELKNYAMRIFIISTAKEWGEHELQKFLPDTLREET
jgi:hypothetical protein